MTAEPMEANTAGVKHEGCNYSAVVVSHHGWFCTKCGRSGAFAGSEEPTDG